MIYHNIDLTRSSSDYLTIGNGTTGNTGQCLGSSGGVISWVNGVQFFQKTFLQPESGGPSLLLDSVPGHSIQIMNAYYYSNFYRSLSGNTVYLKYGSDSNYNNTFMATSWGFAQSVATLLQGIFPFRIYNPGILEGGGIDAGKILEPIYVMWDPLTWGSGETVPNDSAFIVYGTYRLQKL